MSEMLSSSRRYSRFIREIHIFAYISQLPSSTIPLIFRDSRMRDGRDPAEINVDRVESTARAIRFADSTLRKSRTQRDYLPPFYSLSHFPTFFESVCRVSAAAFQSAGV